MVKEDQIERIDKEHDTQNSYFEIPFSMAPQVLLIPAVMVTLSTKAPRTVTKLTNNSSILRPESLEIKRGRESVGRKKG